ncbi:MAG: DoxX family membrane protein [Rhodothermales bacterium]|nr:DoxX family membrane protein [Rhodothermales bacterium]MBO6778159.1 DoxX family membrane protein [Rhodothermales bacterium]
MKHLPVIGRVLFSVPFILMGLNHLVNAYLLTNAVPSFLPAEMLVVRATGILLLLGGLAILAGYRAHLAALILGIFLMMTALLVHLPEYLGSETAVMGINPFLHMVKDFGLGGAAFFLYTIWVTQPSKAVVAGTATPATA